MREVNVRAFIDQFEWEFGMAIRDAIGQSRERTDENEVVRFFLRASRRACSSEEYEALEKVAWSAAKALHETVIEFGFPRDERAFVTTFSRNLPQLLSSWVRVSDSVVR